LIKTRRFIGNSKDISTLLEGKSPENSQMSLNSMNFISY
jgi:hypothetical protein